MNRLIQYFLPTAAVTTATLAIFSTAAAQAPAQVPNYDIESIGSLSANLPDDSWASAINNRGTVAGTSYYTNLMGFTTPRPVRWTDSGLVQLTHGLGSPRAINGAGASVGFKSGSGGFKAYQWDWAGVGTLLHFGNLASSDANSINQAGDVVGSYDYAVGVPINDRCGFFRDMGGTYTSMNSLGGAQSSALDLNNLGLVVGSAENFNDDTQAVSWVPGSAPMALGLGGTFSAAYGVNDQGQICGSWGKVGNPSQGFLFDQGAVFNLPTLWPGENVQAADINQFGYTVGLSYGIGTSHALAWMPNQTAVDLQALLPSTSNWVLQAANSVNDLGEIVGWGYYQGHKRGFRMTPQSNGLLFSGVQPAIVHTPESRSYIAKATPNGWVYFFWSLRAGSTSMGRYHVDLANPTLIGVTTADNFGRADLAVPLPSALMGSTLLTQAVDGSTAKVSRVVSQRVQ
jgi:uncharacterized membrane protein